MEYNDHALISLMYVLTGRTKGSFIERLKHIAIKKLIFITVFFNFALI